MKKILACVLAVLLCAPYAFAGEVGRVSYVEGRVDVLRSGSQMALALRQGESISSGDTLRTKSGSKAEVQFNDGSTLRLAQNSRVEIQDYVLDQNNKRKTATIKLDRGKARTIIAKTSTAAEFNILTPNTEGVVKGSDIFTSYQAGSSSILVAEGKLELKNIAHPEDTLLVPAGNSALVSMEEAPKGPRPYLDLEKKMYEQDTHIPVVIRRKADESAIRGVLVAMSGDVSIIAKSASSGRQATLNDIINEGDSIETGENGMVEVKFDNGCGITLKSNTHVKMTKLVMDPKNSEYQNLFDASKGKIKARIENLKGKSSFEVRTPTAICGARATIMYVDVLPNMTNTFFEGGNGYILGIISGINKVVGMGLFGYADSNGTVGGGNPSGPQRSGFTDGWDMGNGTEGYSSPGAGSGYLLGPGFTNDNPNLGKGLDLGFRGPFNDVPFERPFRPRFLIPVPTRFDMTFDGHFGRTGECWSMTGWHHDSWPFFLSDPNTSISANINAFSIMPSIWFGVLRAFMSGVVSNEPDLTFCRGIINGTSSNGGQIYGWAGGAGLSDGWKGVISSLYVDPAGMAGVIFGHGAGMTGENSFLGLADLIITPMAWVGQVALAGSVVESTNHGKINATFDNGGWCLDDGFLKLSFTRDEMHIGGQHWGIWQDVYAGKYRNANGLSTWEAVESGGNNRDGYYINVFEGVDDLNGGLAVDIMSTYIDYATWGVYAGTMLGEYSEYSFCHDNYEGIGFGTWGESPLYWSAGIDARYHEYLYEDNWGWWNDHNEVRNKHWSRNSGIIGSLASPFESLGDPVAAVLMGSANTKGLRTWWGDIDNHSRAGDGTAMPKSIIGASISLSDVVKGFFASLYVDAYGNGGTIIGDFGGRYMPDIEMWLATGSITAKQMAGGYNPHHYHVKSNDIKGHFGGSFDGEGSIYCVDNASIQDISQGYTGSQTHRLASCGSDALWGIYGLELGGRFENPSDSDIWTMALAGDSWAVDITGHRQGAGCGERTYRVNDYWFATVDGNQWSDGQLTGDLNGVWFARSDEEGKIKAGIINGKVAGDYIDVEEGHGTWQAGSAGEWVEVTDLLDEYTMFGEQGLDALNNFVNVPITEVCSSALTGAGSIAGGVSLTNLLNDFLNFTFGPWENGEWTGDYSGTVGGNPIHGQAGGTYGDGVFTGAGGGIDQDILNTITVDGNYGPDGTISDMTADVTLYTNGQQVQ